MTEERQKNEIAQTEFRFIKTITIIRGGNYVMSSASISALLAIGLLVTNIMNMTSC